MIGNLKYLCWNAGLWKSVLLLLWSFLLWEQSCMVMLILSLLSVISRMALDVICPFYGTGLNLMFNVYFNLLNICKIYSFYKSGTNKRVKIIFLMTKENNKYVFILKLKIEHWKMWLIWHIINRPKVKRRCKIN